MNLRSATDTENSFFFFRVWLCVHIMDYFVCLDPILENLSEHTCLAQKSIA